MSETINLNQSVIGLENVKISFIGENNGYIELFLESSLPSAICSSCFTPSSSVKNYHIHPIIHQPIQSIPIKFLFKKRCFRCLNPSCSTKYFTEQIPGLKKKHIYTDYFNLFLADLSSHMDFPTIKNRLLSKYYLDIPLSTIHFKLKDIPKESQLVQYPVTAKFIGLDEISYATGHCYAVVIAKLAHPQDPHSRIIDMVAGGKTTAVAKAALNSVDTNSVEAVCIDFWDPYRRACKEKLLNAIIVVDKFHVVCLLNDAIKDFVKNISLPEGDKSWLKENIYLLLTATERLNDSTAHDCHDILQLSTELATIYDFKEQFRALYLIKNYSKLREEFWKWIHNASNTHIPELVDVAHTFSEWFTEISNYWICPITNSITEGKNNKIRVIQRKAYNYINFAAFRYQVLKAES